jgi:hypothetical protein
MDVVHVSLAIGFITNEMFPKPALPQSSFTPFGAAFRNSLAFFKVAREISLNQTPTGGKIGIAGRQRQNAMQMIGQNHDGINAEGMLRPNLNESRTQQPDLVDQQPIPMTFRQINREKPSGSGDMEAAVFGHAVGLSRMMRFVPHRILRPY